MHNGWSGVLNLFVLLQLKDVGASKLYKYSSKPNISLYSPWRVT